jgi:hypothetical protein
VHAVAPTTRRWRQPQALQLRHHHHRYDKVYFPSSDREVTRRPPRRLQCFRQLRSWCQAVPTRLDDDLMVQQALRTVLLIYNFDQVCQEGHYEIHPPLLQPHLQYLLLLLAHPTLRRLTASASFPISKPPDRFDSTPFFVQL